MATWDGGTTLPAATDDVFTNNKTVTIDQDITVLTLRSVSNASPAITAGGGFVISSVGAGVTRNISITNGLGNVGGTYIGSTAPLLTVSATAGTINLGSTAIAGGATSAYRALRTSAGGTTIRTTGRVSGGTAATTYGIVQESPATLELGTVAGGSNATAYGVYINLSATTCTATLAGAIASTAPALYVNAGSDNSAISITGPVTASATANAVYSAVVAPIRATGPLTHGPNGHAPINAPTWMCKPTATAQSYNVYDDTNSPATGVLRSLANVTSGSQGPAPADVRTGTAYGQGLVGTMAVPAASSVASGVSVDATTGTAALSGDKVWTYNVDTGVQAKTRLLAASTLASDGAAIAAALTA